jgi:uncharacterized protein (DUF302 family)
MTRQLTRYGIGTALQAPFEAALARTRSALAAEGFGILCEIDIAGTLRSTLGVDARPYVLLGACNPALAHRALTAEPAIGLLLPCNVAVYATAEEGETIVAALDPEEALELAGNDEIRPIAHEVKARLERVLDRVAAERR